MAGNREQHVHKNPATSHPTMMDISWFAGLYEGEGCAHAAKGKRGRHFGLSISQKDPEILLKTRRLFGGVVGGPYKKGTHPIYRWDARGARGRGIAFTIFGFLSNRRKEQIMNAIALENGNG